MSSDLCQDKKICMNYLNHIITRFIILHLMYMIPTYCHKNISLEINADVKDLNSICTDIEL